MSGRYNRTYGRKKTSAPPISQFDRLVSDPGKGTHPVAAKTAGHVGKWGMTSFTSLRYINGKEDQKRGWDDSPPPLSSSLDPFSIDAIQIQSAPKVAVIPKRRKFFKSRDSGSTPSPPPVVNVDKDFSKISKSSWEEEDKSMNLPNKCSPPSILYEGIDCDKAIKSIDSTSSIKMGGCGIKLKIFKSQNSECDEKNTYSSSIQLPSDESYSESNSSSRASSPSHAESPIPHIFERIAPNGAISPPPISILAIPPIEDVTLPVPTSRETIEETSQSPNMTLDTTFDSSFEFGEIVDQRTGLPLEEAAQVEFPNSELLESSCTSRLSRNTILDTNSSVAALTISQHDSIISSLSGADSGLKLDLISSNTDSHSDLSNSQSVSENCIAIERTESKDCSVNNVNSSSELSSNLLDSVNSDSDNPSLFDTNFDENEIVDRTNLNYSNKFRNCVKNNENDSTLARADTLELKDAEFIDNCSKLPKLKLKTVRVSGLRTRSCTETKKSPVVTQPVNKKRSIFKSRTKDNDVVKKRATYKHKWHGHDEKEDSFKRANEFSDSTNSSQSQEDPFEFETTPTLNRVQTWPTKQPMEFEDSLDDLSTITSVKCQKKAKQFYTVIKNVKKTHQLQESGEFQEFTDDVEYFMDALKSTNSFSTRCLASLNLAQKCMVPAFRMHLRAHATVTKFFRALSDAPTHRQLAECSAMVMFALSQDRLNMDLDRSSLELMLNLLDTDYRASDLKLDAATADHTKKINELCKELQIKGHAKHLKLDRIDASTLAMETLLSLTSKRAGEWFKEELRQLGGVNRLVKMVTGCSKHFETRNGWTVPMLEKLSRVDRCLKVLENVTHQNECNQEYLMTLDDQIFALTLMKLLNMCHLEIPLNPEKETFPNPCPNPQASKALITTLITTLKVLINLTHSSRCEAMGCKILGQKDEIYMLSLYCLLIMPDYLNHDTKFEVQVLACCLLLNLVEKSSSNRNHLMNMKSPVGFDEDDDDEIFSPGDRCMAMPALTSMFYSCEESAREQEAHTDHIIDNDLSQEKENEDKVEEKKDEDIEDTVARLLQKAGRHMEDTLIAAYTALITGYCIMDNEEFESEIRKMQPEENFKLMVVVLKKFLHFMNLTATTSLLLSLKPTEHLVKYMEKLDQSPEEEARERKKKEEAAQAMAFEAFGF